MNQTEEIIQLIVDYHELKQFYVDALDKFSGPVSDEFPPDGDIPGWRARYNVLAVQKPFYKLFLQVCGDGLSGGQKRAKEFLNRYAALRRRLAGCGKKRLPR